jgi:hypothetical protein
MDVVDNEPDTPFTRAENHLYRVLVELQATHDKACKTNAAVITMDRNLFELIATNTQKAWEQIKEAKCGYEEGLILKSLKYIQASIVGLEQKYEDIQAKVTENNARIPLIPKSSNPHHIYYKRTNDIILKSI